MLESRTIRDDYVSGEAGGRVNETLRRALFKARLREVDVASRLVVDPKTVARWLDGRLPLPEHRGRLSLLLGAEELDLWPELRVQGPKPLELTAIYPQRVLILQDVWREFFAAARREINILAYSADFLFRDSSLLEVLADKGRSGVRVQIALGDLKRIDLTRTGGEEGNSEVLAGQIADTVERLRPLVAAGDVELRLHDALLYNSIYRADGQALVNQHVYGIPTAQAPVSRLHQTKQGGMFEFYLSSFDRIWSGASVVDG